MEDAGAGNTKVFDRNQDISRLASRKDFDGAWSLFEATVEENIANLHTFAAAVNVAVRCGKMDKALDAIHQLEKAKLKKDVVICTTLMKGYCSNCQMSQVKSLFDEMVTKSKSNLKIKPNVRTINTYLRGCVQNGEVKLAEKLVSQSIKELKVTLDVSSWEYLVTLLSQSLQTDKVLPILGRLKNERDMQSGILPMNLQLARSAALLGDWKLSRKSVTYCETALTTNNNKQTIATSSIMENEQPTFAQPTQKEVKGGKRAWKSTTSGNTDASLDENRNQSLELFRHHQQEEWKQDLQAITSFIVSRQSQSVDYFDYLLPFFQRCLLFNCDSSVNACNETRVATTNSVSHEVLDAVLHKFGLSSALKKRFGKTTEELQQLLKKLRKQQRAEKQMQTTTENDSSFAVPSTEALVLCDNDACGAQVWGDLKRRFLDYLTPELYLDCDQVFKSPSATASGSASLKMEICSGAGEWAVEQANHDRDSRWLTLELRHDRVYQTFVKMVFANVSNLAVMAGDAKRVLPRYFLPNTFSTLFVNHPEPPQQIGGIDSSAEHLLDTAFFSEMYRILQPGGMLTIVTDNLWYGKLLTRIVQASSLIFECVQPNATNTQWVSKYSESEITLWVGTPGVEAGHVVSASSYFDRLWKRSSLEERYFLVLQKIDGEDSKKKKSKKRGHHELFEEDGGGLLAQMASEEGEKRRKGNKKDKKNKH